MPAKLENCTFTSRAQYKLDINVTQPAKQLSYTLSAGLSKKLESQQRIALKARELHVLKQGTMRISNKFQ